MAVPYSQSACLGAVRQPGFLQASVLQDREKAVQVMDRMACPTLTRPGLQVQKAKGLRHVVPGKQAYHKSVEVWEKSWQDDQQILDHGPSPQPP